jgi:hypothetical protein
VALAAISVLAFLSSSPKHGVSLLAFCTVAWVVLMHALVLLAIGMAQPLGFIRFTVAIVSIVGIVRHEDHGCWTLRALMCTCPNTLSFRTGLVAWHAAALLFVRLPPRYMACCTCSAVASALSYRARALLAGLMAPTSAIILSLPVSVHLSADTEEF